MAGIEDIIEIFRGENLDYNPFKKTTGTVGRFVTDNLEYAEAATDRFPAIIKSAKIPKEKFIKSMEAFDQSDQPTTNRTSRTNLGLLDKATGWKKIMTKIVVRLPEPKKEYTEDNQRQINRSISLIVEQLNSTFLTQLKEDQERFTWFNG